MDPRPGLRARAGRAVFAATLAVLATACSPEVGSDAWCKDMEGKPKGEWTANDAADYAKSCVLKNLQSN